MIWLSYVKNGGDVYMETNQNQKDENQQNELTDLGADISKTSKGNIYTLTIIGQVEGHQGLPQYHRPRY